MSQPPISAQADYRELSRTEKAERIYRMAVGFSAHAAVWTLWLIPVIGVLVSLLLVGALGFMVKDFVKKLMTGGEHGALTPPEILHSSLQLVELTLLIVLPVVISTVVFRAVMSYCDPLGLVQGLEDARRRELSKNSDHNLEMAKRLVLGTLVTVACTHLLGDLLRGGHVEPLSLAAVAILVISSTLYVRLALTGSGDK